MSKWLAISALWPRLAFGALDFDGTNDVAANAAALVSIQPYTFACSVNSDITTSSSFMGVMQGGALLGRGDAIDISTAARATSFGTLTNSSASSTANPGAASWFSIVGVFSANTSRTVYLNGGSAANNTSAQDSDAGLNYTTIGALRINNSFASFANASIAECGAWTVALTAEDANALGKQFAPSCVKPASLAGYYPMIRDTTTAANRAKDGSVPLAITEATVAPHPPVIRCDE